MVCRAAAPSTTATKPPSGIPSSHLLFGRDQRRAHQPFLESVIFLTLCSELNFNHCVVCRIFICRMNGHDSDQISLLHEFTMHAHGTISRTDRISARLELS